MQAWSAPVAHAESPWTGVALINLGEADAATRTPLAALGLPPAAGYLVADVWTGQALGRFPANGTLSLPLRPHASRLLRVTAA